MTHTLSLSFTRARAHTHTHTHTRRERDGKVSPAGGLLHMKHTLSLTNTHTGSLSTDTRTAHQALLLHRLCGADYPPQ